MFRSEISGFGRRGLRDRQASVEFGRRSPHFLIHTSPHATDLSKFNFFAILVAALRKTMRLFLINAGYHAVTFTLMGGILGLWL